jgi:hypothetical protein
MRSRTSRWRAVIESVAAEVATRYEEILAWRAGRADRAPHHPRALVIIDEIQQVTLACPDLLPIVDTLARQALEAGVRVWILTQRPDAKDAVPGAIRDQLVDRACFGPLSSAGAKMTFDMAEDWHRALGVAPVPGRALTWLGGVWRTVQAPWLPIPADTPAVEPLYPPRASQGPATAPAPPSPPKPSPAPSGGQQDAAEPSPAARPASGPTSLHEVAAEILRDYGDPPESPSAAYDPTDPYAGRRRRRRRD